MALPETFESLRPAIVAFISRLTPSRDPRPIFPRIIGTGYFVTADGLIATNRHVAEALLAEPRHPVTGELSCAVMIFLQTKLKEGGTAMGTLFRDIKGIWPLSTFSSETTFYGNTVPDIAFIQAHVRDTPSAVLYDEPGSLRIGMDIATAGFPLGTPPMVAHGKVSQLTPLLRRGIVSSLYPFPCPNPHGFTIDAMVQGGASGSPVFLPARPAVVGMIEAGFDGTNITIACPAALISQALDHWRRGHAVDVSGFPGLSELVPATIAQHSEFTWETIITPSND